MGKARFNISEHISKFIAQLKRKGLLTPSDLDEATDYLYSSVDEYMDKGYTDEEAFVLTKHKYGDVLAIQKEYAKVNTTNVIVRWLSIASGVLVLATIVGFALTRPNPRKVVLTGKVHRSIDDTLMLFRTVDNFMYDVININIKKDSTFQYILEDDCIQEYALSFRSGFKHGMWFPEQFYNDGDTIKFHLYPMNQRLRNISRGSRLKEHKTAISHKIYSLIYEKNKKRRKYGSVMWLPDSVEYIDWYPNLDSLKTEEILWTKKYYSENPSIVGYYKFYDIIKNSLGNGVEIDKKLIEQTQQFWSKHYPKHPLRKIADHKLASIYKLVPGEKLIDLALINEKRDSITLSSLVQAEEYTLLDIGYAVYVKNPDKSKSDLLFGKINEVTDQKIQVIGIVPRVGAFKDLQDNNKEKVYPWDIYGEIDFNIAWDNGSGLPYASGSQVLIDKQGLILAVNPDLDKLDDIIKSRIRRS